jgi:thymidylate kinase
MSQHPILVLDGPDGSGKTTLAMKLCASMGAKYIHLTFRWKNAMFNYHTAAIELALKYAEKQPVVIDRWWPSELIYANVFRHGSNIKHSGRFLDRVALKHGLTYVFCNPSNEAKYFSRFKELEATGREMYTSMEGVYQGYQELYKKLGSRLDCVHYDIDTDGKDLEGFVEWLESYSYSVWGKVPPFWSDNSNRMVAGSSNHPDILFVGDESPTKTRRKVWPFFEYDHSSLWFTEALARHKIPEYKLAWVNSAEKGIPNFAMVRKAILTARPKHVVMLGHKAAGRVTIDRNSPTQYHFMKHPQWYKRFSPSEQVDIINLKRLLG